MLLLCGAAFYGAAETDEVPQPGREPALSGEFRWSLRYKKTKGKAESPAYIPTVGWYLKRSKNLHLLLGVRSSRNRARALGKMK